ncbi:MAG TPA: hypothetical protein VFQ40_06560 [Actinomycetota bacterium]|nr:hypothetical protein [Actinomycetota bacterium]
MQTRERFRFVAIVGLVIALLTAGISLADGAFDTSEEPEPTVREPIDDGEDTGDEVIEGEDGTDEGEEPSEGEDGDDPEGEEGGEQETEEGEDPVEDGDDPVDGEDGDDPVEDEVGDDPVDGEDCEEPEEAVEEDDAEADRDDLAALDQEFTEEDCTTAAGVEAPEQAPVPGALHGLENAIAHVLWNCVDHPNHGLVNALTKLTQKLEDRALREELKAERTAEREAAKAEREAAKAEREAARAAAKAEREAGKAAAKAARELSHSS